MHEFKDGMPRQEAEHKAYNAYRKTQHLEAAAFHLRGLKSAQGSGDLEEAKKHGAMYALHAEKLGFEPWKEPPPELKVHLDNALKEKVHKFKAHRGDQFVLDDHKIQAAEPIAKSLNKLYKKAVAALEHLQKSVAAPYTAQHLPQFSAHVNGVKTDHIAITHGATGQNAGYVLRHQHPNGMVTHQAVPKVGHDAAALTSTATALPLQKASPAQEALTKGWPKDDQENQINTGANQVAQDHLQEQGFKAKVLRGNPKQMWDQKHTIEHTNAGDRTDVTDEAWNHNFIQHQEAGAEGKEAFPGVSEPGSQGMGWATKGQPIERKEALIHDDEFWHSLGRAVGVNPYHTCANCGATNINVGKVVDPEERISYGEVKPSILCPNCEDTSENNAYDEHEQDDRIDRAEEAAEPQDDDDNYN